MNLKILAKTIVWRLIAISVTYVVAYIFTKEIIASLEIALVANIIKTALYYGFEVIWQRKL